MEPKEENTIKKANTDPLEEALSHPNGPSLSEMINSEEEKRNKKRNLGENEDPENGPVPII